MHASDNPVLLHRMLPGLRNFLVAITASVLAVWIGISLAQEDYFVAALSAGASLWVVLSWTRGPLAEAWLLAFLFVGYVIGNRGFAQINPVPGLPVFFSELGLGFAFSMVVLRCSLKRELPLRRDWLNGLLLFWLALGAGRLALDIRQYGFMAMRDFAMVYYVLYFFTAQALAQHEPSRRLLHQAIILTFAVLPVVGLLATTLPVFFLTHFLVAGVPLIFIKGDLLATFLFTGYVILLPSARISWNDSLWRWAASLVSLTLGLTTLSRSSLVGLLVAIGWLALAGRFRHLRTLITVCAVGLFAVTVYSLLRREDFTRTKAYAIYEAAASIFDYSGTANYENEMSSNKGDNNRFRLIWWKNVAEETLATSPVTGLGFGHDLAKGFLLEYYPTNDTEFTARSPHNVFVTVFGRMGLLGVAALLAIYWVIGRGTARAAQLARLDSTKQDNMTLYAAIWVIMISACFGVVLEGPMGAMPFWIMLGLVHFAASEVNAAPIAAALPTSCVIDSIKSDNR
ncbi:MAG: O-antigen ligase family protein [Opitutae bacterium]|nr:O-antigen ligase family protein [Opitutae bacterium]